VTTRLPGGATWLRRPKNGAFQVQHRILVANSCHTRARLQPRNRNDTRKGLDRIARATVLSTDSAANTTAGGVIIVNRLGGVVGEATQRTEVATVGGASLIFLFEEGHNSQAVPILSPLCPAAIPDYHPR
jgi:hypothetical protein